MSAAGSSTDSSGRGGRDKKMEFIKRERKKPERETAGIQQRLLSWPDAYYRERSPQIRMEMLEEAERQGLTPEDNAFRRVLYDLRYDRKHRNPEGSPIDLYIKAWMDIRFLSEQGEGLIFKNNARKLDALMGSLGFDRAKTQAEKNLLYQEFYHLGMLYLSLCIEDKNFNSFILGLGTISEDRQARKIAAEYRKVAITALEKLKRRDEYQIFSQALINAYCDMFPDYAEVFDEEE